MLPKNTPAPCAGKWALFDSVQMTAHMAAAAICATCPFRDECAESLLAVKATSKPGYGPVGTWAGRLQGVTKAADLARFIREDAAYSDTEARECHAAFRRGGCSAYVTTGYHVHERRRKRAANIATKERMRKLRAERKAEAA